MLSPYSQYRPMFGSCRTSTVGRRSVGAVLFNSHSQVRYVSKVIDKYATQEPTGR